MARDARGGARAPPIQDHRKSMGRFHAKVGRTERAETVTRAVARKQDLPLRKIFGGLAAFGLFCAALYAYLAYVVAEDEDEAAEALAFAAAAAAKRAAARVAAT